jgi:isocitrate dehydrogenase (NAD+)
MSSISHPVTLIRGDGIGPEIMDATVQVLQATGVRLGFDEHLAGAAAMEKYGHPVPHETIASLNRTGVGLKGPLIVDRGGLPVVIGGRQRYATANAALRGVCSAFCNVRPVRSFPGVRSRYADVNIDLVIVREVSEGIYLGREQEIEPGCAEATLVTTWAASVRIARFAFELARREHRRRVTAIHKANVLAKTDGLFLRAFHEVAQEYPDLEHDDQMIDAAAALLILDPSRFDIIVAPNQYGDILSDMTAALTGSLGLGPGGNYGPEISLFEACHGAATDIAGRGIANPIALILSGAMLLEHLAEHEASQRVRHAVATFLAGGAGLTPDIGGDGTTEGTARRLVEILSHGH